jgi:predicted enzyme related to lactoylglutathione lyase
MARVVHFEITADNPERAAKFYEEVFGWGAMKWEGPQEYWLITTGNEKDPGIDGGLARREDSPLAQPVTNTIDVADVDEAVHAVEANGGEILVPKGAVPGVGWLSYFKDTEGNIFGMMEADESAK